MKSPETVLTQWTSDEIQFNGMIFTRIEITRLAYAIQRGFNPEEIGEHKFAATYLNWEKVRELKEAMQRNIVPEISPQFLANFWSLDELVYHAKLQRPHRMHEIDWDLPF